MSHERIPAGNEVGQLVIGHDYEAGNDYSDQATSFRCPCGTELYVSWDSFEKCHECGRTYEAFADVSVDVRFYTGCGERIDINE